MKFTAIIKLANARVSCLSQAQGQLPICQPTRGRYTVSASKDDAPNDPRGVVSGDNVSEHMQS